jgi:hypothetical protein
MEPSSTAVPPSVPQGSSTLRRMLSAIVALIAVGIVAKVGLFRNSPASEPTSDTLSPSAEPTATEVPSVNPSSTVIEETSSPAPSDVPGTSASSVGSLSTVPVASQYKDGTYAADGAYTSPGGAETIGVTLTIIGDVITDAKAEVHAEFGRSKQMQTAFAGGFGVEVIGKKINEVHLDKVSGSSLTPAGFNDALEKIKAQAKG